MVDVYFSIGTNLGDRQANISRAVSLLDERLGSHYISLSSIVESKAWGFEGKDFLDCAIRYKTDIQPHDLLRICKEIEKLMGRDETVQYDASGKRVYHDRVIDIDILLYGNERINDPDLVIPHPLIEKRDFIKGPLLEILDGND